MMLHTHKLAGRRVYLRPPQTTYKRGKPSRVRLSVVELLSMLDVNFAPTTVEDLVASLERVNRSLSRRVYKMTDCGAWGEVELDEATGRWWFRVGSIVEGSDREVGPVEVELPCRRREIWRAIEEVEEGAAEAWDATHGCETCAERLGEVGPIDPECPDCDGEGVVL